MAAIEKLVTIEAFEAFLERPENRDRNFELIHGEIGEKMPNQLHGRLVGLLVGELYIYFKRNPSGQIETEVRYRLPGDQHNSRQPDLSVSFDLDTPAVKKGAVPRMPDFAVEVKSPDDSYTGMRERAAYFIANGSWMVWLIFPEKQLVEVYRPGVDLEILNNSDTLTGYDLFPGFSLAVKDIFAVGA